MSLWGALLAGCNLLLHGAGWLESGLTASYEKFILDIEMLQMFAELFQPLGISADDMAVAAHPGDRARRPFLRRPPHPATLSDGVLCATGVGLAQFRPVARGGRQDRERACHGSLAVRPSQASARQTVIRPFSKP